MRKYLVIAVTAIVGALVFTSVAPADDVQSITANLTPTKRDKKKFKPATIYVEILTNPNSGAAVNPEQPPSADNTKVNFPANSKFDPTAVPRCKATEADLQNTTTDTAVGLCGKKSVVSTDTKVPTGPEHETGTSAWVTVDLPGNNTTLGVAVAVTAFNADKKNTLYLHSRADAVNNTTVLVGKLKKGPKGYGSQLDVTIPPLLAGAIARFTTTVKGGKYVQARCKSKSEKWQAVSHFTNFNDAPSSNVTDDYTSTCKQKKKKRK